jgi:hypothetical protein
MSGYVRKADGTVYGPVPDEILQRWAADGRIAPEDQLSADQEQWQPAADRPELKMDWLIPLVGDQHYGPVHPLALREPLRRGDLHLDTPLVHRAGAPSSTVGRVLLEALLEYTDQLERERPPETDPPADPMLPPDSSDPAVSTLIENFKILSTHYDRLLEQLQVKTDALRQESDQRQAAEREAAERLRRMDERLAAEQEKARAAERRLADAEEAHRDLLKTIRELNDRFIRLRQEREAPG